MLDTTHGYEATLRAESVARRKRLNVGRVPAPIQENPARSVGILTQPRGSVDASGAETCGAPNTIRSALSALIVHSVESGIPITFNMVEFLLRGFKPDGPRRLRIDEIQRLVCHQYNITMTEMCSARRTANLVRPRMVAMYLSKLLTLRSYPEIGRKFGKRDHTTVLHSYNKMSALILTDPQLAADVEAVKALAVAADPGLGQ